MTSHVNSLLYTLSPYQIMGKAIAKELCFLEAQVDFARFANGELHLTLSEPVLGKECFILGSINPREVSPIDDNLLSFLALCHTVHKEKGLRITAILPYLAYSRHDKEEPLKSRMAALIGKFVEVSGVDKLITFDVHSPIIASFYPIPLVNISSADLFAEEVRKMDVSAISFVAPDEGAVNRCKGVAKKVSSDASIAFVKKKRCETSVFHLDMEGSVKKKVVIIDDILDTGITLISCCKKLIEQGVEEIVIMITHGLFTGTLWEELWDLKVKKIYTTDTIPLPHHLQEQENIVVLSVVPLLIKTLKNR